jgi:hypothetical protein
MRPRAITRIGILAIVAIGLGFASFAVASARHQSLVEGGNGFVGVQAASALNPILIHSTSFQELAGSGIAVGQASDRFYEARFTAESSCFGGPVGNWCSVKLVARNESTNEIVELNPQAGTDYQFDSVGKTNDGRESHAIERSIRLDPGTYTFFVQGRTTSTLTTLRLDDWHFAVEVIA